MADSANVTMVKRFYDIADGKIEADPAELFTEDVSVYTPRSGIVSGLDGLAGASKVRALYRQITHNYGEFGIVEHGDRVIVEGTTAGETVTGLTWDGRKDIAGHFCAVYDFRDGLISRMYVYYDPDLGHGDADR
ncbi:nuclear transport factor 2 family protein [Streptomyces mirabilis]|uniref:nuclear transport factor 2 family protein n=1 Tax=Streptomyces mirabilis TaxID=68239 RepID=UPI00368A64DB